MTTLTPTAVRFTRFSLLTRLASYGMAACSTRLVLLAAAHWNGDAPTLSVSLDDEPIVERDYVMHPNGKRCIVDRIGWHDGAPSPFYGDNVLRAFVASTDWYNGDHFTDWVALAELTKAV